jgi:hypothetical protein
MRTGKLLILVIATLCIVTGNVAAQFIWIEGEDATSHTMKRHNWYDRVNKEALSQGEWLSHFQAGTPPEALYDFQVPQTDTYTLWIRANSVAGPRLSYKLDRKNWAEVDLSQAIENLNIADDGKPDMRFISWVNAGPVALVKGKRQIHFKFHSPNNNHGGLDCFVFTVQSFLPRGALKPGARTGKANDGYFAWEPSIDTFGEDALLDLRYLNEAQAGQAGRIQARGESFTLADGTPVKFWAVNAGPGIWGLDDASHRYLARHLAKHGVNMIRLHGGIYDGNTGEIKEERLDRLQHLVWAMKQEGIYTKISFYFPAWFRLDSWHREKDRWPFMLLFFDADMQALYFNWARGLLTTPSPYTGLPLGEDPAVAILEIQNEDSHFFYTFKQDNCPPERWETLKSRYGQWLIDRYGSLDLAIAAWGHKTLAGDHPSQGRMDLLDAWAMTTEGLKNAPVPRQRMADQVRFLAENMRGFYEEAIDRFRTEGHYQGLVSCGNWHTADARMLDALERYCYTAGDVIDRHGYFDPPHQGEASSWSVRPGQTFQSESALHLLRNNPLPYVETAGYPNIISEIGWPMPNMYRAESAFLCAAYGSLLGLDGIFHFSVGSAAWDLDVGKFVLNNPVALGGYFAPALVYRRQDIQEAPAVVIENLDIEKLMDLQGSAAYVRPALDQLRAEQISERSATSAPLNDDVDPTAFYVGRVVRHYRGQPDSSSREDVTPYLNRVSQTITSATGQLVWDYGAGVATVNTPQAQGGTGFWGAKGPMALSDVSLHMKNDYGTLWVVALDNQPLSQSRRVLIQGTTLDQPYGWKTTTSDGLSGTIEQVGGAPWGMQKLDASITLKWSGSAPVTVTACDENGYRVDKTVNYQRSDGEVTVQIEATTAYTLVTR